MTSKKLDRSAERGRPKVSEPEGRQSLPSLRPNPAAKPKRHQAKRQGWKAANLLRQAGDESPD